MSEPVTSQARTVSSSRARIDDVFTPSSPVRRRELFAGRAQALQALLELIEQPGRHAVVFGERGAGKSSLVAVAPEMCASPIRVVRVSVTAGDTFASLWQRVAEGARAWARRAERGLVSPPPPAFPPEGLAATGATVTAEPLDLLAWLSTGAAAWVVFDDFDRAESAEIRARMRDLAQSTASSAPGATLVFAGTGRSGDELIGASTALVPVHVPRMTSDETIELVLRGLRLLGRPADDLVVERIATFANGLPQAAQALARATAIAAADSPTLGAMHLGDAVVALLDEAPADVASAYDQATVRARRGIYPEILLACALAPRGEMGAFAVRDVCDTLTSIVRREVRGLTNQVSALTEEGRGSVLEKRGAASRATYRFVDPRLEGYILLRGLEQGWTTNPAAEGRPGPGDTLARAA
ncbi:MAG TPA: AAA family ATPase [Candidatus Acidoferrales bacterium]|nr:AAA family ATPase [Candidatus Acidoferrales bacterium]